MQLAGLHIKQHPNEYFSIAPLLVAAAILHRSSKPDPGGARLYTGANVVLSINVPPLDKLARERIGHLKWRDVLPMSGNNRLAKETEANCVKPSWCRSFA
jgi:hypothetical protein